MKWISTLTVASLIVVSGISVKGHAADLPSLTPETVADYVYAVVESHRAFYASHVVELLEEQGIAKAGGEWHTEKKTVPLPVQVLNETSQRFSSKFNGLRYQLISLWPINVKNSPRDQVDKSSLEGLNVRPERPISRIIKGDAQTYFRAIYPDVAVSQACVSCHNNHPKSPKRDFQVGDIMGGLVIEFPVNTR